jgi:hypothetical protein
MHDPWRGTRAFAAWRRRTALRCKFDGIEADRVRKGSLDSAIREQGKNQPFNIASAYAYMRQNNLAFAYV